MWMLRIFGIQILPILTEAVYLIWALHSWKQNRVGPV